MALTRVDPAVCRIKFDREVSRFTEQQTALQGRGIFVCGTPSYPFVDLIYLPRHAMQMAISPPQNVNLALPQDIPPGAMAMAVVEIPSLSARAFKARFDLTDYDLRPPSVEFRDPWTDALLSYSTMFRAFEYEKDRQAHVVLLDDHPITHKPFLCLRGVREYHEHPQHSGDEWLLYRAQMNLFSIAMSLWRASVDLVHPMLVVQPNGVQVQWNAEPKS